ncbi:nuclear transport factor 2 family protein [Xenorhabdus griffiniae]|uniref:nuclear transport factor 2 family protein n=1 Tax=Xenorhabdus griffiniae TaxID=351672 RepID=UPI0023585F9A|nr:nuclear transport factor 2 family protein [Xenorhabdus griffiniae]MDC9605559.1 nuclear transport factor 2 family protein [Xenorhabdus griffiniae]
MRKQKELIACQSVIDIHQWIENVFTNKQEDNSDSLNKLLNSFTPDFTMITLAGQHVSLNQVKEMFVNSMGSRPNFKIEVDNCTVIAFSKEYVAVRYREKQTKDGNTNYRWSLAVISFHNDHPQWRYLHETAISE